MKNEPLKAERKNRDTQLKKPVVKVLLEKKQNKNKQFTSV